MNSLSEVMKIGSQPIVWALCAVTVVVSLVQSVLFTRLAKKTARQAQISPQVTRTAFRVGLISAIGPAIGVFIVMVGLMTTIGAPMAWLRLSIIGAAPTELTAATLAAEAAGSGLGKDNFTVGVMAVTWFAMALNGCGWLLVSGLGAPYLEKIREKMGGGDAKWLAMIGGAASLGVFGYLCANDCRRGMGNILAVAAGAISMVILVKFVVSKHPKFSEYSLGVAMLIGMACAVLHDVAGF
ncbi:MAG: DUF5058 family protein [Pyramidobacter sp.]